MTSEHKGNGASPIRKIREDEKDAQRQWPSKKHLASSHNIPMPKPGEKNRIHSVLVALPVLMLMIGLYVYFKGEHAQNTGQAVLSELVVREGQFKSVSEVSGIGRARFYLWYTVAGQSKGVRISESQKVLLAQLTLGDALSMELVPKVAGSKILWVYRASHNEKNLISPTKPVAQ